MFISKVEMSIWRYTRPSTRMPNEWDTLLKPSQVCLCARTNTCTESQKLDTPLFAKCQPTFGKQNCEFQFIGARLRIEFRLNGMMILMERLTPELESERTQPNSTKLKKHLMWKKWKMRMENGKRGKRNRVASQPKSLSQLMEFR